MAQKEFNGQVSKDSCLLVPNALSSVKSLIGDKVDKVHPVPTNTNDFIHSRVGGLSDNKQVWIKGDGVSCSPVQDSVVDSNISAALYSFSSTAKVDSEKDLIGSVSEILSMPVEALDNDPTMIVFYSISSFGKGAGRALINDVYDQFSGKDGLWLSTLSPMRGFSKWLDEKDCAANSQNMRGKDHATKLLALNYLIENKNEVQKFHMGNGAYIGDINLNANIKDSDDYRDGMNVMVNYVYPDWVSREFNKDAYKSGHLTFASHLYADIEALAASDAGPNIVQMIRDPSCRITVKPAMF